MQIDSGTSLTAFCFIVCTQLERNGARCVLVGGSAATFYAPHAYQSRDADFVIMRLTDGKMAAQALADLGFSESQTRLYRHPKSVFTLEFPAGPLGIGDDLITTWDTIERDGLILHVYTRTDAVRDRLASFFYYSDRSALAAAVAVANSGSIDLSLIQDWSRREGQLKGFAQFEELFRSSEKASF